MPELHICSGREVKTNLTQRGVTFVSPFVFGKNRKIVSERWKADEADL